MSVSDLLQRRRNGFALWLPQETTHAPALVIGKFVPGAPPSIALLPGSPVPMSETAPGLWEVPASKCGLASGEVYHYWFEIDDAAPWHLGKRVRRTDPLATTTDWRVMSAVPAGSDDDSSQPAGVIQFQGGKLVACDPVGDTIELVEGTTSLPANNFLVIYELPPRWSHAGQPAAVGLG